MVQSDMQHDYDKIGGVLWELHDIKKTNTSGKIDMLPKASKSVLLQIVRSK